MCAEMLSVYQRNNPFARQRSSSIADLPAQEESRISLLRFSPPYQAGSKSFRSVSEVQRYAGLLVVEGVVE